MTARSTRSTESCLLALLLALPLSCASDSGSTNPTAGAPGASGASGMSMGGSVSGAPATGGLSSGGSAAGTPGAGAAGSAGASGSASGSAGTTSGGGGGPSAGSGGAGGASAGTGGAAGAGGSSGSGGSSGGKGALATIAPTTGNQVTGAATFTQNGDAITLVIQVSNCPAGNHATHIHLTKDCGNNGLAAGDHWIPQGEGIPDIACMPDGMGTVTFTPANGTWTIGGGAGDVTTHAIMVHQGNNANPAGRIGCGVINVR